MSRDHRTNDDRTSDDRTSDDGRVEVAIRDQPEANRYELVHDGVVVGVVDYRVDGDVFVIPHVEVVPALRGRGHSAPFLDAVLEDLSARGKKVRPVCSYAVAHLQAQPERSHLLA